MAYFDLTEEQLEDVRRTEVRRRRKWGENIAEAGFAQQGASAAAAGAKGQALALEDMRRERDKSYDAGFSGPLLRAVTAFPDPDGAAKDFDLAMDSGIPLQLIRTDPQAREQAETIRLVRGRASVVDALKAGSPIASEYLRNSGILPLISDEPESLIRSEGLISSAVNGYKQGSLQQRLGRARTEQLFNFGAPDEKLEKEIADIKSELETYSAARPDALLPQMLYGGMTQAAQRRDQIARGAAYAAAGVAGVAALAMTGGLAAPGMLMTGLGAYTGATAAASGAASLGFTFGSSYEGFVQEAGLAYDELLEITGRNGEKLDPNVARTAALMVGAINAGIEFTQLSMFLKHFPGADKLLGHQALKKAVESPTVMNLIRNGAKAAGTWLKEVGLESGQEVVQEATNIVARNAAKALSRGEFKYDTPAEIADELISTFGSSAIDFSLPMMFGPLMGGMRNLSRAAAMRRYRIERARGLAVIQDYVNQAAKEGPLASRAPQAARDYLIMLNDQIKNPYAKVYMAASAVRDAAAADAEKRAGLLKTLGVTDAEYSDALATGSDLVINSADFALLAQSDEATAKELISHLKADAEGPEIGNVKAATKEHAGFIRSAIDYASRVIAPSVSEEELIERAKAEGVGDVYVKASVLNQLFQEAAPQTESEAQGAENTAAETATAAEKTAAAETSETENTQKAENEKTFAGLTLDKTLEAIGISRADFDKALENDEDLQINIDRLISGDLPKQLYGSLRDDLMAEAGAMTLREAREWAEAYADKGSAEQAEGTAAGEESAQEGETGKTEDEKRKIIGVTAKDVEGWRAKAERDIRDRESAARVRANVKAQLLTAGVGDKVAQAQAEIFAAHIMRSAQRLGLDPETYFKVYANVKFMRGGMGAAGALNQDIKITRDDFDAVQSIIAKSVNELSSDELDKLKTWAAKFWQELGVKSPFFRSWFGDWRENDVTPITHVIMTGNKKTESDSVRNNDTGWDISISGVVRRETRYHNEKRQKHGGKRIVNPLLNDCLDNINDIVENAVLLDSRTQKANNQKTTTAFMHSMYSVVADKNGNRHVVKLFVEEMYNIVIDGVQRRAFQVKEVKIGTPGPAGSGLINNPPLLRTQSVPNIRTVSDLFKYVKANDSTFNPKEASKIVDAEGKPIVFSHYTDNDFNAFDINKARANSDVQAFFLAPAGNEDWIDMGKLRMDVYLNIRNPKEGKPVVDMRQNEAGKAAREKLIAEGYDGVIERDENGNIVEVLAFYPEQIKSTENRGTFNPEDPNIYLQSVYHGSPYNFSKFQLDSIGSGEGAQAYGWGLYFAGKKEVSEWYRKRLSRKRFVSKIILGGEEIEQKPAKYSYGESGMEAWILILPKYCADGYSAKAYVHEALAALAYENMRTRGMFWQSDAKYQIRDVLYNLRRAAEAYSERESFEIYYKGIGAEKPADGEEYVEYTPTKHEREFAREILKYLDELNKDFTIDVKFDAKQGQLYQVDIPDEKDGNYLLWDKEVTKEQAERIAKAMGENGLLPKKELLFKGERLGYGSFGDAELKQTAGGLVYNFLNMARLSIKKDAEDGDLPNIIRTLRKNCEETIKKDGSPAVERQVREAREALEWLDENEKYITVGDYSADTFLEHLGHLNRGRTAYEYISKKAGAGKSNDKAASMLLKDAGFAGIKYLDGLSRAKGEGSYNYVIFDDNAVQIMETYYQAIKDGKSEAEAAEDAVRVIRGAISIPHTFGGGTPIQITITPNADASTAVHEMSHYFLWEMGNLAQLLPHDAELQADLATAKKWLGWKEDQTEWTREQQEKWARGFEAYLREGKAPSTALARAFARFKTWLCDIYRSMRDLNVELSDDIRGVFDRLLASEEETEAAMMLDGADMPGEGEASAAERIVTARGKDMTERRAESVKADVLSRILHEAEEARKLRESQEAEREMARITEEVRMMPVYRAIAAMRSGRMKMSDDRLIADHGPDVYEGLPEGVSGMDGELSADEVAEEFGYGSGEELLAAIKSAPAIEDEVRARFAANHPEADMQAQAKAAAEDAAYGDDALDELIAEREDIAEAAGTSDEDWATIEAEDDAARAAWNDPRSRPNCVRWIRKNGGLDYDSVKYVFGDKPAAELLRRCGPGLFGGTLSLDVAAESMTNEGAYFGQGNVNADQELYNVLMGDNPPLSPLEVARREGFAEARAYAKKRAEARRAAEAERAAEKAERKAAREAETERRRAAAEADKKARREAREELKRRAKAAAEAVFSAARDAVDRLDPNKLDQKIEAYKAAEAAAKKEYSEAVNSRDWETAADAKDRQILNRALAVEARRAAKMVKNAHKRIADQLKRTRQGTSGMSQTWLDQIDLLFARFGIIPMSARMETTQPLAGFAVGMASEGYEPPVADWIMNGTGPNGARNFTVGQMRDFDDALAWLIHGAREAGRLSREFAMRDVGAVAENIAASIRKNLSVLIDKREKTQADRKSFDLTKIQRAKKSISRMASRLSKIEMICRVLDGGERMGPAHNAIFEPIVRAEDAENAMTRIYTLNFRDLLYKSYSRQERKAMAKKHWYQMIGKNLSKEEVLCIALNSGNAINLERVMTGFGWNEQQLRYVIESTLDGRDWDFVQGVWDMLDTLWPQIAALQRDISGWVPERVRPEARTWHIKGANGNAGRTVLGGYYPIVYNKEAGRNRFIRRITEQEALEDIYGGYWSPAQTKQGYTKARDNSTGYELLLNLNVIPTHFTNVIHDLTHRKAIIDVNKLLTYWKQEQNSPFERARIVHPLEDAIIEAMGEDVYDQFHSWLKYVASGEGNPLHAIDLVCRWLRRRTQIVVLGLKAAVSLSQINGFFPAMHEVGFWPLLKNIFYFYRHPWELGENARAIWEKSEAMRSRSTSRDRDVRSLVDSLHKKGKFDSLQESYFTFINLFDAGVVLPIWITAYEKGMRAGWEEGKAIAYADSVVRGTQDIGTPKDLSAIQRGRDTYKIFTMFYNAMNTQLNMVIEDIWLARAGRVSKGHLIGTALYVIAMPSIFGALITGHGPKDDDDDDKGFFAQLFDDPARVAAWCAKQAAKYPFAFIPLLRDVENYALDDFGRYRASPAFAPAEQMGKTARDFAAAAGNIMDGETEKISAKKLARDAFTTGGYLFGYPAGQLNITFGAIWDLMEGEKEVRPADFFLYRKR